MKRLNRVDIQVSILTFSLVVVSCFCIFFINYRLSYNAMIQELQNRANGIYTFLEERLDGSKFESINVKEDMETDVYHETKELLKDIRLASGVRYLYTAKLSKEGEYIYIIDGLPLESEDFRNPGDPLEEEIIPDIKLALKGEIVMPQQIKDTSWGYIFISYFPIHEGDRVIGAVGIEFDAQTQYQMYRNIKIVTPCIILLFCMIASLIAVVMFRRISNPTYRDFANTDMLTGLANRNAFDVMMHNLSMARQKKAGFISIDFDGLKQVNDSFGHDKGDEYIRSGTRLIQSVISGEAEFYRIGGDEFVIVSSGGKLSNLQNTIEQIESRLKEYNQTADIQVQFSMGGADFDEKRDSTLADTLKRADENMYIEKKGKKAARESLINI